MGKQRTRAMMLMGAQVYGVHHFGLWKQQGHSGTVPALTEQTVANLNHVVGFYRSIAPVIKSIGMIFNGIYTEKYKEYHKNYKEWAAKTPLSVLSTAPEICFTSLGVVRNLRAQVAPYKDTNVVKSGWVVMCCWGDFTGGNLVLPDLKVQWEFRTGDVLFFRADLLKHAVATYEGNRTTFVFYEF